MCGATKSAMTGALPKQSTTAAFARSSSETRSPVVEKCGARELPELPPVLALQCVLE